MGPAGAGGGLVIGTVLSVNVGAEEPNAAKSVATGIDKLPQPEIHLRAPGPKHGGLGSGVLGDFLGDTAHHGGDNQAVYAVAREELDWWGTRLGRKLGNGGFGENLTTVGLDVDNAVVGEIWQIGSGPADEAVRLRVTAPRIPCGTFAQHMGVTGWLKMFVERGLSGAYLAIEKPGSIRPGDTVTVLQRPEHAVTVPVMFRAYYGDESAAAQLTAAGIQLD